MQNHEMHSANTQYFLIRAHTEINASSDISKYMNNGLRSPYKVIKCTTSPNKPFHSSVVLGKKMILNVSTRDLKRTMFNW